MGKKTKTLDPEKAHHLAKSDEKTAETHLGTKTQHPRWRLPLPQHSEHGRRNPRDRVSHAPLSRDWLRARRSWDSCPEGLRAPRPDSFEPAQPGTTSRGGGTEARGADLSRLQNHLLGRALVSQVTPWARGGWQLRLVFFRVRAQCLVQDFSSPWKTGFSTACQTSELVCSCPALDFSRHGTFLLRLGSFRQITCYRFHSLLAADDSFSGSSPSFLSSTLSLTHSDTPDPLF